jgi:ADP-ribose pyrophosphatase YjhB (NUDIX family)
MREWTVAGAVLETPDGVLLVRNVRRGGFEDWSTPGGVIDTTDHSLLAGLTREVEEETGLRVTEWSEPLYEVHAVAPDMGWRMRCEVYAALAYEGDVVVDDPDGIVVEATFVPHQHVHVHLEGCAPWVSEPLLAFLTERWIAGTDPARRFHYEVHGTRREELRVVRESDRRCSD